KGLRMNQSPDQKTTFGRKIMAPLIEPVYPLTQLSTPTIRARRAVIEFYEGQQANPDDAMLPMPPHNRVENISEIMQKLQKKLISSSRLWYRALQLLKQRF
ncbi:hypothetical protein KR018_010417, partial [Drosophila ironensis]